MTPKVTKLFDDLEDDLRLTGLDPFADRVAFIKKSLTPAPKKVTPKINAVALRLEITENGKTSEVIFQTEKEAEAFLKLKHKARIASSKSPKGMSVPYLPYSASQSDYSEYLGECAAYWKASDEQNLTFTVKISKA